MSEIFPELPEITILKKLKQTNTSTVYLARDEAIDVIVVVKGFSKENNSDKKSVEHIFSERKILTKLKEKGNKLYFIKPEKDEKNIYLILSFINGCDLSLLYKELSTSELSISNTHILNISESQDTNQASTLLSDIKETIIIKIFSQIINKVKQLHKENIVFRDIKMNNILIDSEFNCEIVDYGLAKELVHGDRTFTLCGTYHCMAPEVLSNYLISNNIKKDEVIEIINKTLNEESHGYKESFKLFTEGYDFKVDYYSLGVFIYELYHGKEPYAFMFKYDEEELFEMFTLKVYEKYNKESKINTDKSNIILSLINKLLSANPKSRVNKSKDEDKTAITQERINHFSATNISEYVEKKLIEYNQILSETAKNSIAQYLGKLKNEIYELGNFEDKISTENKENFGDFDINKYF